MSWKQRKRLLWVCAALSVAGILAVIGFTTCEIVQVITFFAIWGLLASFLANLGDKYWHRVSRPLRVVMVIVVYIAPPLVAVLVMDFAFPHSCSTA